MMATAPPLIYADHASTSWPVLFPPSTTGLQLGANPSNSHALGRQARSALEQDRARIERLINAPKSTAATSGRCPRVVFTSGSTESNNMVLQGHNWDYIVTAATEHTSVYFTTQFLMAQRGVDILYLPVNGVGAVDLDALEACIRQRPAQTGLVSLMLVNNEVGTVHDLRAIAKRLDAATTTNTPRRVFLHTDAAQAPGHVPLDVTAMGVDFLTFGAHKFHGPVGVGVLWCRHPDWLKPIFFGGHQQGGLRPGTEAVALVRALTDALEDAVTHLDQRGPLLRAMAQCIWGTVAPFIVAGLVLPTGSVLPDTRAPHHVSFCVRGVQRQVLLERLEAKGLVVSGGSACSTVSRLPSHVLSAMQIPLDFIHGSLRITLSHTNTLEEVQGRLCPILRQVLAEALGQASA